MENDPKRINGKEIAEQIQKELEVEVKKFKEETKITPGLAVILVGERKDSATYVRMKQQAAEKIGMKMFLKTFPGDITQIDLIKAVKDCNENKEIHGLIVQLPLPSHIDEKVVLDSVSYEKDVDGLHPLNIGALCMRGRDPLFVPCTPKGCMELLERKGIDLDGKNVIVLGRSNIVGIPVAMLCMHKNATVTICHSKTKDLPNVVKQGDVVIAAVGKPEMVKASWIKEGAVVLDVGINAIDDPTKKAGYRLVGDVDYNDVRNVASLITPVPMGVGPMTVAMLLKNTLVSARRRAEEKKM